MIVSVELSLYALRDEFESPVYQIIERLHDYQDLKILTNGMSTQITGEYGLVMNALKTELGKSFETPHTVAVIKIVNSDRSNYQPH